MPNLNELIKQTLHGDMAAYESIIKRFQGMATAYAYSILKDSELARDASQEAFITAYYNLTQLIKPEAFPGWFKRIVFKQCDRLLRTSRESILPDVQQSERLICPENLPDAELEIREMRELVNLCADTLSSEQRTVLLLFYIRDYSLNDIASFLEIPVSTVKKRLFDARRILKERITKMVKNQINSLEPKEIFSQKIIRELLKRPDLLRIPHNPVAQVFEMIRQALPEYEFVDSNEIIRQAEVNILGDNPNTYYHLENNDLLRTSTTPSLLPIFADKKGDCKIILAGRVFRQDEESATRAKVFYQTEVAVIGNCLGKDNIIQIMELVLKTILPDCTIRHNPYDYSGFYDGVDSGILLSDGTWLNITGGAMFKPEILEQLGIDTQKFQGFSIGFGLDRLAMAKFGINTIQELYKPENL